MKLNAIQETFINQWAEMGGRWGINRSVAAVHALLYLSPQPLSADEVCEALSMARSNVSQAIKELEDWELIRKESRMGERKSYFRCESDVWEMARCIIRERKKRETEGALRAVNECLSMAKERQDAFLTERLESMQEILTLGNEFAERALKMPKPFLVRVLKMGGRVFDLLAKF